MALKPSYSTRTFSMLLNPSEDTMSVLNRFKMSSVTQHNLEFTRGRVDYVGDTSGRDIYKRDANVDIILKGNASARELCASKTSFGPSFYSVSENVLCDMSTKTIKQVICKEVEDDGIRKLGFQGQSFLQNLIEFRYVKTPATLSNAHQCIQVNTRH